jgi:hypothetical protein
VSADFFGDDKQTKDNVATANVADLSMDDLFEKAVDMDDVRRTEADSLRPVGTYVTGPKMSLSATRADDDAKHPGRLNFRFFGPSTMVVDEAASKRLNLAVGTEVKGAFGFNISPERHNNDKGEPDLTSKLWSQAVRAYEVASKSKPGNYGDVAHFLRDYPVKLRVIQMGTREGDTGEPGNLVVAISAVRE